jgi:hypothetical protein
MAWNDNIIPSLVNNYARTAGANAKPYSGIVVHVTGKQTLGDELNWMKTNGQGLGYHYVIDRDGTVYQTAPLDKRMNQITPDLDKSYNNNNALGVAMVAGGTPGEEPPPFSPAQLASGKTLIDGLRSQYNIPTNRVVGHGQIQTDREAGNKLNAAGGFEGQDFINYYNKSPAPSSDGSATTAAPTAAAPSRPGSYGQTGIALLNAELAKRGIGPAAASGAIAGIMGESGANLDPTSFNSKDPGGGSGGIGQWNRTRLVGNNGMLAFAKNAGVDVDVNNPLDAKKVPLSVQAQYVGHELDTTYAGVANQLKTAATPQDALKIWVNSYENPADKQSAIAQRSQYLDPVGKALAGGAPSTAAASTAPAPIGTTLTSVGGGDASKLPGFGTAAASKSFTEGLEKLAPGITGGAGGQGGQGQQPQPSPIIPPPSARNVAPPLAPAMEAQLTGYVPKPYGQTLNSFATPLEWGSAPPGASPYAPGLAAGANPLQVQPPPNQQGAGTQTSPIGTSLTSLQNMDPDLYQQRLAMLYGTSSGSSPYGGG